LTYFLKMMSPTKKILAAFLLIASLANAQEWTRMMQDPNANFYDIVKEFDNYWKDRLYERGHGYKAFKRWQWFVEPRVYPSGNMKFSGRNYALEKYNEYLQANSANKTIDPAVITATNANWIPLGPFGSPTNGDAGRVQVVRMHPAGTNTFYVGTAAGGFWMTNNAGVSYTTTTDQMGSCGVSDIAICSASPNIIYISTGDRDAGDTHSTGVFKSSDGGLTWNPTGLSWSVALQHRIYRLLLNPQNPNSLIAATDNGMYKSCDAGATWSMTANGVFVDAEYRPADTTVVHVVTGGGYYKSTNGGMSYNAITISNQLQANRLSLAVTAANNNYVYILVSNPSNGFGGLYRSTNDGGSFTLMSSTPNIFDWSTNGSGTGGQGWYDIAIDASPANANEIVAGGVNSWKSTNGGSTWALHTHWTGGGGRPYVHADLHYVGYANGTTYFYGTDGGVARTTNSGTNWSTINGNMNIAQVYKLGLSASTPSRIVTGHQDNGTNLWNGTSWSEIYGGDGADCFIDWSNNSTIVQSYVNGDFHRSTNGGANWTSIVTGLTGNAAWVAPIVQSPSSSSTYFCGYQQVYKSTNQGSSWTQMGNIGVTLDEIKICSTNTNVMYATSTGAVYKSVNGGTSWSNISGALPTFSAQITDLAMNNQDPNIIFVTFSGFAPGAKVFMSTDGGVTWNNYGNGLPNVPVNCIVYQNNSPLVVYVGTDVGVFYREASLNAWIPYNTGLPNIVIDDMEIYYPTSKLRAGTYARGVWETDLYSNPGAAPTAAYYAQYTSACISVPLQFNDASGNNPTTWSWSFPGGSPATSTVQNPSITYSSTGVYTVTLISANGNGTSTPYVSTVSVVNAPTISPVSNSICTGQTAPIGVNTDASLVQWSTGQQGLSINVTASATTVYSFTASAGACNTMGTNTLYVFPPIQTPTVSFDGTTLSTTVVALTYQWYYNGGPIPGATSATYQPGLQYGYYSVWVGNGGCQASSTQILVSDVGVKEINLLAGYSIGPNPVKDQLYLGFPSAADTEFEYEIQNNLGQLIYHSAFKTDAGGNARISVQTLPAGVYYLKISNGKSQILNKFIRQSGS
jgi:PKD repeat protein